MANGWGGKRAGAGRTKGIDTDLRAKVLDRAWDTVMKFFDDEKQPPEKKLSMARFIVGKSVPQNLSVEGDLTHNVFMQSILAKSKGAQ